MRDKVMSILFYILTILMCLYILTEVFRPEKTLDYFGFKAYVVVTESMEPDINVNDVVVIKKVDEDELEVRDVITFEVYIPELNEKSVVTHYIGDIEKNSNGERVYYTQGATKEEGDYDEWTNETGEPIELTYSDIQGEVKFTIPYIGHLTAIFRDVKMVLLLGLNVAVIYVIVKVVRSPKKD